jgi:hypothetical protein
LPASIAQHEEKFLMRLFQTVDKDSAIREFTRAIIAPLEI